MATVNYEENFDPPQTPIVLVYEERRKQEVLYQNAMRRIFCVLGVVAIDLETFEKQHQKIVLGQE